MKKIVKKSKHKATKHKSKILGLDLVKKGLKKIASVFA